MKRLYLAHPLTMRHKIRNWELGFEERQGIELYNPFYDSDRDDVRKMDAGIINPRSMKKKSDGLKIVNRDLKEIRLSDGILAFMYKGMESIGTPMEVFYSSRVEGLPTYIISDDHYGHPWLVGLATERFRQKEDFETWLNLSREIQEKE